MQPEPIVRMNKSLKIVISNEQRKGASGEKTVAKSDGKDKRVEIISTV